MCQYCGLKHLARTLNVNCKHLKRSVPALYAEEEDCLGQEGPFAWFFAAIIEMIFSVL